MCAGVSIRPLPSALSTTTVPAADRLHQPRHAQQRIAAQFQRIAEAVVEPPQDQSTGSSPASVFRYTRLSRTVRSAPSTSVKPQWPARKECSK